MNPNIQTQINIFDATPGALGRWSSRFRGHQNLNFKMHTAPPKPEAIGVSGIWILAPDSVDNLATRASILSFASMEHSAAEIVVIHNTVSQLPRDEEASGSIWIDAREPERSIVRTLSLALRLNQNRQFLESALQLPIQAESRHLELEQESRNKDEFLATMSHELRTPLNAILSCTEAMREGAYGLLEPDQLGAVRTIRESGKHLLCLITDILDISKIEAGRLELNESTFGVQAICDSVTEMMRSAAQAKCIDIITENNTTIPTLKGDPLRIKQILLNLLGNAIKFTPEYTEVGMTVEAGEKPGTIRFQVWDSGPGIDASHSSAIFKPFVQAEGSYSRSNPGTGLGLAIARDLARLHDGDLTLESFDKPGAIFNLILPVGEPVEAETFDFRATGAWAVNIEEEPIQDSRDIERVLIAEDTDSNFQYLSDLLVSLGYQVDRAHDGQEAIERCQSFMPDLVLMDIDMPHMNGLDAIRLLRLEEKTADIPIIAVTAMAGIADEQACMAAGANGFLAKPYPLRDLMMMMQQVAA